MKILAIRGENLASLAEEFEIDLARGALGEAGVFAIVGPTGAGKTTLLDAICVALFDRTPRLANRSPFQISRGDNDPSALGAHDVRTLLRRGAAAGWAEVDFEGGDGKHYRARWSVRRARGATNGNLLDQQLTLASMTSHERLGGTKTETLKEIQHRLGLTFDQFRRSALLAQGDFAAFLRADGKDRSELLERMTGTEIYSKLSLAAHHRAASAEQQLRECRGAAMAISVMADDVRAHAEAELTIARATCNDVRVQAAAAEAYARWLGEAIVRQSALADAEEEYAAACKNAQAGAPLREELASLRRAERLRPLWESVAVLGAQSSTIRDELAAIDRASSEADGEAHTLNEARSKLSAAHAPIRAARIGARIVEFDRASSPPLVQIEPMAEAATIAAVWLSERRALATEIATWPELERKLAQHRTLAETIGRATAALEACSMRRDALRATKRKLVETRDQAKHQLALAYSDAELFAHDPGTALDAAGRAEDAARTHLEHVSALAAIAASARSAAAAQAALAAQLRNLEQRAATWQQLRTTSVCERDVAVALRDERLRALGELRKVASHAHARTELVDNEPCPLCGSADHPWANRGAVDHLIDDAERAYLVAGSHADAAAVKLAELEAAELQRSKDHEQTAQRFAVAIEEAHTAAHQWKQQWTQLSELAPNERYVDDPSSPAAEALVTHCTAAARERLDRSRQIRNDAIFNAKAFTTAQTRIHVCRTQLEAREIEVADVDQSIAKADADIAACQAECGVILQQYQDLTEFLTAASTRWAAALPASDRPQVGPDGSGLVQLSDRWRDYANQVALADAALSAALARTDRSIATIEREMVAVAARRSELQRRSSDLTRQRDEAAVSLGEACNAADLELSQLPNLLANNSERVAKLTTQTDALQRAIERTATRVAERLQLLDEHERLRPSAADAAGSGSEPLTRTEIAAALAAAQAKAGDLASALVAAEQKAAAHAAALSADAEARDRRDAALSAFANAERAVEIDRVLGEVIGSHDGKLFRSFAQSLTLDSLLAVANSHLEELSPRYQLERVPKHDLELQVLDRDFGGEVRSVQSLSGGECFLVSLALALGLSSMSAHDVRVRTLLIDEGFGTLDPATLDCALAVLDELQATGRQVGIISHVPALLDRVHAHIRVSPRGGGRSKVVVPPTAAAACYDFAATR
jgi:exonuclease SbcC